MILKTLRLKNFRKFQDTLIEFPDGVTGIIGLNGAGKSTIFEALAWTLYGPVAARTPADQIKREGVTPKESCRTELEFSFGENKYRIIREMTGKNHIASASATENGALAATGAEDVSKYMQKKLGMDFKSFYTSIFAKQKELNALSSMNPSERRPLILRMLGISSVDEIIAEIRSDTRRKKDYCEKIELDLLDEKGEQKIKKITDEQQQQTTKQKEITTLITKTQKEITRIDKKVDSQKKENEKKKIEYEKLRKLKDQLDEHKIIYDRKKTIEQEIKNFQQKIQQRKETIQQYTNNLKKFSTLDQEFKNLKKRHQEHNIRFETTLKDIEQNKSLIKQIKEDIEEIERKKSEIKKIGPTAKCPTCERILGEQYTTLLQHYIKEIGKNLKKTESQQEKLKKAEEKQQQLTREQQALEKKDTYLQSQWREKEKITATLEEITKELQQEKKELEQKTAELKKIETLKFDEDTYKTIKNKVKDAYNHYQTSLQTLNEIRNKLEHLKLTLQKHKGDKNLITQKIKTFQQQIKEQQQLEKKLKEEKKQLYYIKQLDDLMSTFRTYLISQIRPTLSMYASELFTQLTDGKYAEIELDDNYNLNIYDQGTPHTIDRFSGGEEDLANLCIRLAISEVITERAGSIFNFIVLDEIFGSQDIIRRQNIIKSLNSFSQKFRQIFLITHIEDIKNFMEHTITVNEQENGISTIKIE